MRMRGRKNKQDMNTFNDPRVKRQQRSKARELIRGMFAPKIKELEKTAETAPEEKERAQAKHLLDALGLGKVIEQEKRRKRNLPRRNTPKVERRAEVREVPALTDEGRVLLRRTFNHDVRPRKKVKR